MGAVLAVLLVASSAIGLPAASARNGSDAPFGAFAGYVWLGSEPVTSVAASFDVPRILGTSVGLAGTWIGAQSQGDPDAFSQFGVIEKSSPLLPVLGGARAGASSGEPILSGGYSYDTFWSDRAQHFQAQDLFAVQPGDRLRARLVLAAGEWSLAVADETSGMKTQFSTQDEADRSFKTAEFTQEDPAIGGSDRQEHAPYPSLTAPTFGDLAVDSAAPSAAALYSTWMSVNGLAFAPTPLRDDSFTVKRAPRLSAAASRYLRLVAPLNAASVKFDSARASWTVSTPAAVMQQESSQFIKAGRRPLRALARGPWPTKVRALIRELVRVNAVIFQRAQPPSVLTEATLAAWASALTAAEERSSRIAHGVREALGDPGLTPP